MASYLPLISAFFTRTCFWPPEAFTLDYRVEERIWQWCESTLKKNPEFMALVNSSVPLDMEALWESISAAARGELTRCIFHYWLIQNITAYDERRSICIENADWIYARLKIKSTMPWKQPFSLSSAAPEWHPASAAAAGGGAGPMPSLGPSPALGPAPANHLWTGSDWVHQDSAYARSAASVASGLFPVPPEHRNESMLLPKRSLCTGIEREDAPPALGRAPANHTWFGGKWVPIDSDAGRASLLPPPASPLVRFNAYGPDAGLMSQLSELRQNLLTQQANLTEDGSANYEALEKKIQAIHSVLLAFA